MEGSLRSLLCVQVNYVRKYVLLVLFLALASNYVKNDAGFIPRPTNEWIVWQGLTDLRVFLLEHGRLNEALSLFKVERTRLPPIERPDAVQAVSAYVRNHFSLSEERSVWVDAELTIYLAQSFYENGQGGKGAVEFQKADALLDHWCSIVGNQEKNTLSHALDIKLVSLRHRDFSAEPLLYYTESSAILELFKAHCHTSTTVCYGHTIEAARGLMTVDGAGPYNATFYRLLHELQEYQEHVLEDVRGMFNDQNPLFVEASGNNTRDSNKVLEWLDSFARTYPEVDIPTVLMQACSRRRLIYTHRQETEKQAKEEERMEKLKDKVPTHVGVLVATRPQKAQVSSSIDNPVAHTVRAMDIDEENFFLPWVNVAGKSKETRAQALQFLLQWMLFDLKSGVIEESEIRILLGTGSGSERHSTTSKRLEELSSDSIFSKLYLCVGNSPETVIEEEEWDIKSKTLESWLLRPSKPTFNGRQYLRVVLQELRKDSVIEYRVPLHRRVSEIEKCISMVETLPPKVREFVSSKIILWKGSIADEYFRDCVESRVFNSKQVGESLTISLDISLQVIDEFQKLRNLVQLATRQRSTAEVCLFKLYWILLQPGRMISDPDLLELQGIGLDLLEKAEEFFTPLLREVTWSHGLDSIEERERSISTSVSWRIPQLAVRLLIAGGIPVDDSKRKRIWTWVQRSKARALAMAMGNTGTVPAALLQQIMASEQHRRLYEEMLSLEQQIEAVEPLQRYALRQKLDLHVENMRNNKTLAEFCNIKDGRALTWSDLDTIMGVSNSSAVLVDWFHVYVDATDEGSILLLTARSGSTPTINLLSTKPEKVSKWINSNLSGDSSVHTKDTTDLDSLVQPLAEVTKPGETLVFCASGNLHRLPLHSIDVVEDEFWQPLIYRNPIIYTHSHSVLRLCVWNAQAAAEAQSPLNPLIMNGIPDTPSNARWAAGRASVQKLASLFGVAPQLNSSGTKEIFVARAPSSRLIHVHSHVEWTDADPLAHSIHFAPTPVRSNSADVDIKLSAREIFTLSLSRGTHVSLIACSGGLARISPEDEVMGLIPALLYAGASSTISTLWPIEDNAGAAFTKSFYRRFDEARKTRGRGGDVGNWIDVAKAFQGAVIERDIEETRQIEEAREAGKTRNERLHWTAFVAHGSWRMWVPRRNEDVEEQPGASIGKVRFLKVCM